MSFVPIDLIDSIPSEKDIEIIFSKYETEIEQYEPEGQNKFCPVYVPTPKHYAPKPITLEEYKKKTTNQKRKEETSQKQSKANRGGRKRKIQKEKKELIRLMGLSSGEQKRKLYIQLKQLENK